MIAEEEKIENLVSDVEVPDYLVREEFGGRKWYYKGYKDVLQQQKQATEIMGSSSLQSLLVYIIGLYFGKTLDRKKYRIATNEAGLHLAKNENIANDIAIYYKKDVALTDKYFDKPPRLVIEVDVKIDFDSQKKTNEAETTDYVIRKSQKLLDFGVERIIWITTTTKKIYVMSKNERWFITDFNDTIPLFDEHLLNLAELLKEEDLEF